MAMNSQPVAPTYRFLVKEVDGFETKGCHLDVMLPPTAQAGDELPVAFMIHGGAWSVGASSDLAHNQVHYYLDNGYCCVSPEYRLCPHVKQADCRQDVLDAYAFVHDRLNGELEKASGGKAPRVKSNRVFATGGSAGGTASVALVSIIDCHWTVWQD